MIRLSLNRAAQDAFDVTFSMTFVACLGALRVSVVLLGFLIFGILLFVLFFKLSSWLLVFVPEISSSLPVSFLKLSMPLPVLLLEVGLLLSELFSMVGLLLS